MTPLSKLFSGILLLLIPTVQYGGYFLLQVLSGKHEEIGLTEFQQSMVRAGHAHAGTLLILAILAQLLIDHTGLTKKMDLFVRIGFLSSTILIGIGFFIGAAGEGITEPTGLIWILYLGAIFLFISILILAIGLIRNRKLNKFS